MSKKRPTPAFDESFLIGSISGLNRNKEPEPPVEIPAVTNAPEPDVPGGKEEEPSNLDPDLQLENTEPSPAPQSAAAPVVMPEESKGKKKSASSTATPKSQAGNTWEYERFLTPTSGRKNSHVYISDLKHSKIRQILALTSNKIAIADYLENVLDEHFEKYETQIKDHFRKSLFDNL
ncbi:hypothetical protein AAE02nite_31760 [Adhaeribacter aerolatus]|uniref:Conjugal transfer protein TraB n=1 Tax=Adhaeribacter aerolatus TaxID=670289 RepID=A0A512B0N4_9BACT|nr:DUF3408 domain-containing protein [Adhaeribacter aerolatus]GEO05512.1 hypothetical protein AAE02nite_31760 [Adhaeribacter aerolatus]